MSAEAAYNLAVASGWSTKDPTTVRHLGDDLWSVVNSDDELGGVNTVVSLATGQVETAPEPIDKLVERFV